MFVIFYDMSKTCDLRLQRFYEKFASSLRPTYNNLIDDINKRNVDH